MQYKVLLLLIICIISTSNTQSSHDYCDILKKSLLFYKAQRSGRLPDNDIPWRGDSCLKDSSGLNAMDANGDGDLSKGYFDAGDHVKFAFPMCYTMTMLSWSFIENQGNIEKCNCTGLYLDVIKWGTDWIIAAHVSDNEFVAQVGNGQMDHSYWGPPEDMKMDRPIYKISADKPGTEVAMEASAALSATAMVFSKIGNLEYSSLCLSHAKKLFTFGDTYRGKYSDSVQDAVAFYKSWSGFKDEIVWAGIWLYKATNDDSYLSRAKSDYLEFGIGALAQENSHDWDLKAPGSALLLAKITGDSQYKQHIEQYLNWWLSGVPYTSGGLAWIRQWGPCRYSMTTAFLMSAYGGNKYLEFTKKQSDYVLGANPLGISYVVGVGSKFPLNPHHRAAHHSITNNIAQPLQNTYVLIGALVGGPSQNDEWKDERTDYIRNEVALDYNVGLVGTIASLAI